MKSLKDIKTIDRYRLCAVLAYMVGIMYAITLATHWSDYADGFVEDFKEFMYVALAGLMAAGIMSIIKKFVYAELWITRGLLAWFAIDGIMKIFLYRQYYLDSGIMYAARWSSIYFDAMCILTCINRCTGLRNALNFKVDLEKLLNGGRSDG